TGPRGSESLFSAAGNIVVAARADKAILDGLLRGGGRRLGSMDRILFADPEKLEFRLRRGSPAVDTGVRIPGFNDDARGAPDVGPFERGEVVGPDWPRPRVTAFDVNPPERVSGRRLPPKVEILGGKGGARRKRGPR
ncbi:unnamed protein product, partial [marine sediment metagenome]